MSLPQLRAMDPSSKSMKDVPQKSELASSTVEEAVLREDHFA
jgi:hypothetical protein